MSDYDVIVIGGGINGLTCAAYLGKAGLKTLLLEARGECGTHCDTNEPGIPGFLHNLHATWLINSMSPCMEDLELAEKFGLEMRATDYAYGKTFLDGKNALIGSDPMDTLDSWEMLSPKDRMNFEESVEQFVTKMPELAELVQKFIYGPPSWDMLGDFAPLLSEFTKKSAGIELKPEDLLEMNGFQILDMMFESEHIKTMVQSLSWIGGFPPIHKAVGAFGAFTGFGMAMPVHQAKGGSHALPHSLVKCAVANGVKILSACPVEKIIVENGEAKGVVLSDRAIYANEKISAKKIISNMTVVPTFIDLIGEDNLDTGMASYIKKYQYDEQVLFGVHYALDKAPQWASADFHDGIQRCFMGYFGGENTEEMERFAVSLLSGRIHEEVIANWFIPTLADPTQAPPGCHTAFVWFDVPPSPTKWKGKRLGGFNEWDKYKDELADDITDTFERYAPGFKKNILSRVLYSPLDTYRNNPSAVYGNWIGGSQIPEQFYANRPLPGVINKGSASRSFIKNLHLSNSISLMSATTLDAGYKAACEVAEDMGVRDQEWWTGEALLWYLANMADIPKNLGVR